MSGGQQDWKQLSSIQIGGAICLPAIMIGQTLSQTYGFFSAVIAIGLGNLTLLLLGLAASKMSYEKNKTTMENAADYFGEKGIIVFALTLAFSLLGWFAIQLNMMSLSLLDLLSIDSANTFYLQALNLALGLIFTIAALQGLKAINFLANISLPLLFLTLGYALYSIKGRSESGHELFKISGVSIVIASAIAFVIDLPTYFKHARSNKDGWISISVIFGFVFPLLEIIGVYLSSGINEGTILDVLKRDHHPLWNLWIATFLILAGWTTNNLNLYSGVMSLEAIFKKITPKQQTFLFGIVGSLLSCFDLLSHFEFVLDVMGIFISSMGAVILTRYILDEILHYPITKMDQSRHLFAWFVGTASGFLSLSGYAMTSIALLDAMIGACAASFIIIFRRGSYEKTYAR